MKISSTIILILSIFVFIDTLRIYQINGELSSSQADIYCLRARENGEKFTNCYTKDTPIWMAANQVASYQERFVCVYAPGYKP
jgi:hypothetical protein